MNKSFLFFLLFFIFCNVFLLSEDIEVAKENINLEEESDMQEIVSSLFQIRQKYIYYSLNSYINNSWEIALSEIKEEIDKIISYFNTQNGIIFENAMASVFFTTTIDMIIIELKYIQQINNDIKYPEYDNSRILHSLYNIIQLCTLVLIINDNYEREMQ